MLKIDIEVILKKYRHFIERSIVYWTWGGMYSEGDRIEIFSWVLARIQKQKELEAKYGKKSLKCFIWRITRRTVIDYYRRRKMKKIKEVRAKLKDEGYMGENSGDWLDEMVEDPEEGFRIEDMAEEIRDMIRTLKRAGKIVKHEAILLDRIDGCGRREIARKHKLKIGQVRGRLYYARKRLAEDWRRFQVRQKLAQQARKSF